MNDLNNAPVAKLVTGLAAAILGVALLYSAWRGILEHSPIHFKFGRVSLGGAAVAGVLFVLLGSYFLSSWWRERGSR